MKGILTTRNKKIFSLNFTVDYDVNDNVCIKITLFKLAVDSLHFCYQFCIINYGICILWILSQGSCRTMQNFIISFVLFYFHFTFFVQNIFYFYRLLFRIQVKLSRNFKYSRWKMVRGAFENRMDQNNNKNKLCYRSRKEKWNAKFLIREIPSGLWIMTNWSISKLEAWSLRLMKTFSYYWTYKWLSTSLYFILPFAIIEWGEKEEDGRKKKCEMNIKRKHPDKSATTIFTCVWSHHSNNRIFSIFFLLKNFSN